MKKQCFSKTCPFYGPNRMCSTSETCKDYTPPTNADRIRGMSNEGLARFIYITNRKMEVYSSKNEVLDWLQQPAEKE